MLPPHTLDLLLHDRDEAAQGPVAIQHLVVAGWTGRDKAALEHHIAELELLGVRRPTTTPLFMRLAPGRLTTAPGITCTGTSSSGEVEFLLLRSGGRLWVGTGSDHTDRDVETLGMTISKQICDKPIAPVFWPFDSVQGHWDQLQLRSFIYENGARVAYQSGLVASMLDPLELMARFPFGDGLPEGTLMFCGTMAAKGGIRPSDRFEFEIDDPVTGRSIAHGYDIQHLPITE